MNSIDMILQSKHQTIIELVDLIGAEHTRKLIGTFGGSHIYIPLAETVKPNYGRNAFQ